MTTRQPGPLVRWAPPALVLATILAIAPGAGRVRDALFDALGGRAVAVIAAVLGAAALAAFVWAVVRIRERRALRYGGLAAVVGLAWLLTSGLSIGEARVDVVEKAHFLEYGLLAVLLYRALLPLADASILVFTACGVTVAGTLDETVQWLVPSRTGEIRDVALDVSAGLCGLLFAVCLEPPSLAGGRLCGARRRQLRRAAALAVLAVGLFVAVAHLGTLIVDPEIGRFRSRYTAAELLRLRAERAREWAADPPTELPVWGIEDGYLTEAAWHAQHRNERFRAGDAYLAWQANRILEKYYDPFLDLKSFRGSGRHRYPSAVRHDLRQRANPRGHDPARYLSPVFAGRILAWPKGPFLAGLGVVTGGLWFWPVRRSAG